MRTKLTTSPLVAAEYILRGELVAFPTETVYGLGASVSHEPAIEKIFLVKGRPADNPLIAHVANVAQIDRLVADISPIAAKLIDGFFPGSLTLVMPKRDIVPDIATAGLDTIGVRMPLHHLALAFLRACPEPLVAPSANLSGRPSPTTWEAVKADLGGRIACILQGAQTEVGLESTVVDCTGRVPFVLRAGAITLEQLREVIPETELASPLAIGVARSPGLKHRHYSPQAAVVLVDEPQPVMPPPQAAYIGLSAPPFAASFQVARVCASVEGYAHDLFAFFRECDAAGVQVIFCQAVAEADLGLALMDRLRRASQ